MSPSLLLLTAFGRAGPKDRLGGSRAVSFLAFCPTVAVYRTNHPTCVAARPSLLIPLLASYAKVDINVQALSKLSQGRHDPVG